MNIYSTDYKRGTNNFHALVHSLDTDLFFNTRHLLSFRAKNTKHSMLSGILRDDKDDSSSSSNGLFLSAPNLDAVTSMVGRPPTLTMYSEMLSFLFGSYELTAENSLNMGHYIDFRRSQLNGFFMRIGETRIKLFNLFKLKVSLEIEQVAIGELKRRFRVLNDELIANNNCANCHLTNVAAYLLLNINYDPMLLQMPDSLQADTIGRESFFVGHLTTKSMLRFPLVVDLLSVNGEVSGFFVAPNPFDDLSLNLNDPDNFKSSLYLEFVSKGKFMNSRDVELKWTMNGEKETRWSFSTPMNLIDVDVYLQAESLLNMKSMRIGRLGSLVQMPKKFTNINVDMNRFEVFFD
jgi:hypothetical protein